MSTPEGWVWAQIRQGKVADLNVRCALKLDAHKKIDAGWGDSCRKLRAEFVLDVLTRSPWREQVPFTGIVIVGARIEGNLDLENAKLIRALSIFQTHFDDNVNLRAAQTDSIINIIGSLVSGSFNAGGFRSDASLDLADTEFKRWMSLDYAKIDGLLNIQHTVFDNDLDAEGLRIGTALVMRSGQFKRVNLAGAIVSGDADMRGDTFDGDLDANLIQVGGSLLMSRDWEVSSFKRVVLDGARVTNNVELTGVTFHGDLSAAAMQVGASLLMGATTDDSKPSFKHVDLGNANVIGDVDMSGATFNENVDAYAIQVGKSLKMNSTEGHKARFKEIILSAAKIIGDVYMDGATVDGDLSADRLQVGQNLFMGPTSAERSTFKSVNLNLASVGDVWMDGILVEDTLNLIGLRVGHSLHMGSTDQYKGSFKDVSLADANVAGYCNMKGATFNGELDAGSLQVGDALLMQDVVSLKPVVLTFVHTDYIDLRGATLAGLDLSGASVKGDLVLGGGGPSVSWRADKNTSGVLKLRNTQIKNLMDAKDAWPDKGFLRLDGFTFSHLGGVDGDTGAEMRDRGMEEWWDEWIRRDPVYTPTPYEQLAGAFVAAGDHTAADEIRFLGRVRQREAEKTWWPWIFSGFLEYGAGFGIGDYTFRVLYWVIGISVAGGMYLWRCVPAARAHGLIWCFGATLSRLLPVIEINAEFSDFFNDPHRKRFTDGQMIIFSVIGMVGWVMGAILIAAVSGLTQKP